MHSFTEIAKIVEEYLKQQVHFPNKPSGLYDPCRYMLEAGGKRVRPALCLMANELLGGNINDALPVAAAYELFHNFTLIHDDIMDMAPLRRGRKTIHEVYGEATGILSGDVMNIYAYKYLENINADFLLKILSLFNRTAIQVCEGQQLDMDYEKTEKISVDAYLKMIELKTSVLVAASLQSGAMLANADDDSLRAIYNFGLHLGLAFQLQDDYLDAFGDDVKTGKQRGGDIKANKKTILWVEAINNSDERTMQKLIDLKDDNTTDKVEQVLSIYKDTGTDSTAKKLINDYSESALRFLNNLPVSDSQKKPLIELTEVLLKRES